MKNNFKQISDFIRAFNFCFGLILLVFAVSIFLTIYLHSFWYLLLAALDVAFYLAFYFVFIELFDYFTMDEKIEQLEYKVENLEDLYERLTTKSTQKEDEIDFFKVNQNK